MRSKIEAVAFVVIAESYLVLQAWDFFSQRPSVSTFTTATLVFLPWLVAVAYVGHRTWTRPNKLTSPTLDELDLAIREHAADPSLESEAHVKRAAADNLSNASEAKS